MPPSVELIPFVEGYSTTELLYRMQEELRE
jgi:hypothetical protein